MRIRHSLIALAIHPGLLTAEFRDGKRARSINPWRLTFNVLATFLALSFVTDFKVASFPKFDPSGTLTTVLTDAARNAHVDMDTFIERVERHFNTIYTLMVAVTIVFTALMARLMHWRKGFSWGLHFVFALHLTAFAFILNLFYNVALRATGSTTYLRTDDGALRVHGFLLLALVMIWQIAYVTIAFRRVYDDGWSAAAAKAVVMTVCRFVAVNAALSSSFFLAIQSVTML